MRNTLFVDNTSLEYEISENCHGGIGPFKIKSIIESLPKKDKQFIKFIHDDIIPPGTTFGFHQHKSDTPVEEWYYCISGQGEMLLDNEVYAMKPGDISVCKANGFHGIKNTGHEDLRIIVILASPID